MVACTVAIVAGVLHAAVRGLPGVKDLSDRGGEPSELVYPLILGGVPQGRLAKKACSAV